MREQQIEYAERIYTRDVVQFLIGRRDQVAMTKDIAEHFMVSHSCARRALERLLKVGRVAEIHSNMWHLE